MEQQFTEVIDGVRDESCDTEVVSTGLGVGGCEGGKVNTGEVEKGVFVVGAIVFIGLVIAGIDAVERSMDFGLD